MCVAILLQRTNDETETFDQPPETQNLQKQILCQFRSECSPLSEGKNGAVPFVLAAKHYQRLQASLSLCCRHPVDVLLLPGTRGAKRDARDVPPVRALGEEKDHHASAIHELPGL